MFGDKEYGIGPFNTFGWVTGFTSTLCQAEKKIVVEIFQVAFSRLDQRVWREDLAPVMASITATAVATTGLGLLWQVCLVGYGCEGEAGTLGSGMGFTLGSDGVRTLRRDGGSFPRYGGGCSGRVGGVWKACRRICDTWK